MRMHQGTDTATLVLCSRRQDWKSYNWWILYEDEAACTAPNRDDYNNVDR